MKISEETMQLLKEDGYDYLGDYLKDLAETNDVPYDTVLALLELLGEDELFDGLITAVEDESMYNYW